MTRQHPVITIARHLLLNSLIVGLTISAASLAQAGQSGPANPHATPCKSPYKKKPVPAKTLHRILQSHEKWLEERHNPAYHRADLCQADLRQANLNGANLERANLEGAQLRQANLYQAQLTQARLAGADLSKAGLEDSTLSGADLRHAS